ncbi:MAG: sugar phosphate isomerase/epimerase [Bacteroidetes bacterium]|nr:MAG: sugar phosphate isomerase/epimerase [Bacteroidota bacterium]
MSIQFFCPRWGSEQLEWEVFLDRVQEAGYQGVELGVTRETQPAEMDALWDQISHRNMPIILQHWDTVEPDFLAYYDRFAAWLEKVKPYPVLRINSQTGRDFFTFEQNKALILLANEFAAANGITLSHETHRHKFNFAAHVTRTFLEAIPSLRITLDASHWVCVAESYLADQADTLKLAISRTDHIHARVGYPEGPQVPDPRVPEWQEALEAHLGWWDQIVALKQKQGLPLTITPEFGPYPYMVPMPFTRQPITSQWEVNAWMMQMLRERYSS